jgi:hypothetical protein
MYKMSVIGHFFLFLSIQPPSDRGEEERRCSEGQGMAVCGGKSGQCMAGQATSDERARGEEEGAVTMLAAMLLHGGAAADNVK